MKVGEGNSKFCWQKNEIKLKEKKCSLKQKRSKWKASVSMLNIDISVAVGYLCRKTNSPDHYDWNAIKRVARYLKMTIRT